MALQTGFRLGVYEIVAPLGKGGMGEVYRARDHELGRTVAIKVLPIDVATDPDRQSRFRREAQTLAALNHPHVGQIYGIAEGQGVRGLVLELVEGPTLADRIAAARTGLPIREALTIAQQIADALDAAHQQGIVHRDLKPANIKLTPAGTVKVLDFGLAKFAQPLAWANDDAARSSVADDDLTISDHGTRVGTVVGTVAYMSPEQARGQAVDRRTDVWAFGCLLFEMLTGRRPFAGSTSSDVLAAILEREPDFASLPAETPPEVRRLLSRCLQKNANQRLRDIGDVRLLIDDALHVPSSAVAGGRHHWAMSASTIVVVAIAAIAVAVAYLSRNRVAESAPTVRMSMATPGPISPQLGAVLSPDGRQLAFVATGPSGKAMLWVRALDSLDARELPGTDRAAHPFWSPDGRSLGFIADSKVKRVDLDGGRVQALADTNVRAGPAWGPDGTILFTSPPTQLMSVPATGGATKLLLTVDRSKKQTVVTWPRFLPDGRHFLVFVGNEVPEQAGIHVGSLDSQELRFVVQSSFRAWYGEPGYLLSIQDETLMAQPFDLRRFDVTGAPTPVADGIWTARGAAQASFSVSTTGMLAYVNASIKDGQLFWFDRSGQPLGALDGAVRNETLTPQISPDGRRVAMNRGEFPRDAIWALPTSGGAATRVTFNQPGPGLPIWSADGRRVLYRAGRQLIAKDIDTGVEETQLENVDGSVVDWSRDGKTVLLSRLRGSATDLFVASAGSSDTPVPFAETPFNEAQARLSPDGHWVAYTSNESGRDEIYVQSFPTAGRKRQVSIDGGAMPRWRGDGRELFYAAANQQMMAVPVSGGESPTFGAPVQLFRTRLVVAGSESTGLPTMYDVTPDGQRFLFRYPPEEAGPPITVVMNWRGAIKR
jgi:Tol biopolymer transport system component